MRSFNECHAAASIALWPEYLLGLISKLKLAATEQGQRQTIGKRKNKTEEIEMEKEKAKEKRRRTK